MLIIGGTSLSFSKHSIVIQFGSGLYIHRDVRKVDQMSLPGMYRGFKGSSDPSSFIFEINFGKRRIRHRATLKLNF